MKKVNNCILAGVLIAAPMCLVFIAIADQQKMPSPTPCDIRHAEDLWMEIRNHRDWPPPKGFEGWQDGKSPHGKFVRYYINHIAKESLDKDGAIIVTANYDEKNYNALASLTVMEKRKDYDPETRDWFYVKYSPDGNIMTDDKGQKVAGLVGKGTDQGCVPCHAKAPDGDYLFMTK